MLDPDDIRALAEAGGAAPSGGNMQPWRLVAAGNTLSLYLDEARGGSFIDVDCAGSYLGLGSFAENVVVAAAARGWSTDVRISDAHSLDRPDPKTPVITLALSKRADDHEHAALASAIEARATNRRPWNGETIAAARIAALRKAVQDAGAGYGLVTVAGDDKPLVAAPLAEADVVRTFHRGYYESMLSELRWTPEEAAATQDGVDIATLELSDGDRKGLGLMRKRWFVQVFVTRSRIRRMTETGLEASSHLGAVTMPRDLTVANLVRAGRALERAWLLATADGLALQPWCVLPFFAIRAERHPDTLGPRFLENVTSAERAALAAWSVPPDQRLIFTFRLSIPDAPPTTRALRRPWTDYTEVNRVNHRLKAVAWHVVD